MTTRRLVAFVAATTAAISLSACSQSGQLGVANPNVSQSVTYNYTAIGASDAVGYGSSNPCPTALVVIGPDSELMPSPANCPGGTGYVPVISRLLSTGHNVVNLTDLGISGAVIGPDIRAIGNTYEPIIFGCSGSGPNVCVPGDFLSDELPLLPSPINTVTIFAGGNDTNAIFAGAAVIAGGGGDPTSFIDSSITSFGNDYVTLLGAVHQAFPFARIYVANLPNFGLIPRGVCLGASQPSPTCPVPGNNPQGQALLDVISTSIDAFVINALAGNNIPVIDLECDGRSYDPANFFTDGFHPNDSGYSIFAHAFSTAIVNFHAPPPSGSCGTYSQSSIRHTFSKLRGLHLKYLRY
jgi:lysophospholipase L1-like esterase